MLDSGIIKLVQESESLGQNAEERDQILNNFDKLTDDQKDQLVKILLEEKRKILEIEKKYNKKRAEEFQTLVDEHKEVLHKLEKAHLLEEEKESEEADEKEEEELLQEIENS